MKGSSFIVALVFGAMMASCTILSPQLRLTGVIHSGESIKKTGIVTISVQPAWENPGRGNAPGQKGHSRISGFYVEFRNTTDNPVYIVWDKSTLKYNNGSFSPFLQGQKYEDFSRPMNAMIIPPNGMVKKYIYSSQQPYNEHGRKDGWKMRPIETDTVDLVFCVQSKDVEDYYTIEVRR